MRFPGIFFADTLVLHRLHTSAIRREGRFLVGVLTNLAFSLLWGYILLNLFQVFVYREYGLLGDFFLVAAALGAFGELSNLINLDYADNVFSIRAVEIFPISKRRVFVSVFANDLIGIRTFLYAAPALVVLYYAFVLHPASLPLTLLLVLLFYFFTSALYATADFGYSLIKYGYGRNTERAIMYVVFVLVAVFTIAGKYLHIDLRDIDVFVRRTIGLLVH